MPLISTVITVLAFMTGEVQVEIGDSFVTHQECVGLANYAQPIMQRHPDIANAVVLCVEHPEAEELTYP